MTRPIFWATDDSYVLDSTGAPVAGSPVKIYTAQVGGTQVTDLVYVNASGASTGAVPSGILVSDGNGLIPSFAGPDAGPTTLWGNHGQGGARLALTCDPVGGGSGGPAGAQALTRTTVKTSAYTAAAGDLVPVDTTGGAVTITLPTTPANGARVAVKHIIQGASNVVTVQLGGSDVLNKAGGSTSAALSLLNQGAVFEYSTAGGIWTVTGTDLPLSSLNGTYAPVLNVQLLAWALVGAYRIVSATRDANGAATTASIVWPDGSTGTFTTDTASTTFPGKIDAYHVTYVNGTTGTKTVTQTAVTRDANAAITAQPALTIA